MGNVMQRICWRVVGWLIVDDGYRLDVCGFEVCQQFMQVRDVEPATVKVGTLITRNQFISSDTEHPEATHDFALKRWIEDRIERVERIW